MIYSLTGTVHRLMPPQVVMDVEGVGYLLTTPSPTWESLREGSTATVIIYTYVREDRLDLYGFATAVDRDFFMQMIGLSGIGPKTALEICSIPRHMLMQAVARGDAMMLTKIKGVGKKTAEKLLVDLQSLYEKHPDQLVSAGHDEAATSDTDALAALVSLGFEQGAAIRALKKLPPDIKRTEEKVTAILRSR